MRTLWNVVSFLAVVHLLALVMLLLWLWQTERLDGERIETVRSMLSTTIGEQARAEKAAAAEAEEAATARAAAARRQDPPLPSAARVHRLTRHQHEARRAERRLEDVRQQFLRQITLAEAQVEEQRDALETRQQRFEGTVESDRRTHREAQLAKAVKLLESLPPKRAKAKILELVDDGKKDEAVLYLDAMNQRIAGKILTEFKTEAENELATELLERIRTRSLDEAAAGDASDADALANARP